MKRHKPRTGSGNRPRKLSRLRIEHNLEKEPLRTGRTEPGVGPAERARFAPKGRELHHRSWLWLALWLVLIVLGAALAVLVLFSRVIARYFEPMT